MFIKVKNSIDKTMLVNTENISIIRECDYGSKDDWEIIFDKNNISVIKDVDYQKIVEYLDENNEVKQ